MSQNPKRIIDGRLFLGGNHVISMPLSRAFLLGLGVTLGFLTLAIPIALLVWLSFYLNQAGP